MPIWEKSPSFKVVSFWSSEQFTGLEVENTPSPPECIGLNITAASRPTISEVVRVVARLFELDLLDHKRQLYIFSYLH